MYHINHEGKIYPCRAKVLKCPYGDNMHAETKEELYYKSMKMSKTQDPAKAAQAEIAKIGRLKSLRSSSDEIASSAAPIELILSTLDYSIENLKNTTPEDMVKKYTPLYKNGAIAVSDTLNYGLTIPSYVPIDIRAAGRARFEERTGGIPKMHSDVERDRVGFAMKQQLEDMRKEFNDYQEWQDTGLNYENYQPTMDWMVRDFNKFSHDLNTSKLITAPMFYGDIDKAKEVIANMDDYELLSAYDDSLISDAEIQENVDLANGFEFTPRRDLTPEANAKLKEWYDRNKAIVENWKRNTPKRVILSIEMARELDRRKLGRQDGAVRK